MKNAKYGIIGVIDGQEFRSMNNTKEELNKLAKMIVGFGGFVVEIIEEIK